MLLTKSTTFIIGPVATLLGYIMNGIFWVQSQIGIESIGLCIILFTIVIYMLLMPLTIKQQKFSKLQSKMNPELQAIQKKYKDKRQDQAAMMKMNEETQPSRGTEKSLSLSMVQTFLLHWHCVFRAGQTATP